MSKKKASELTPIQRMGRRNKHRGYSTEVQLVNFLKKWGVFAKRVVMSGALKSVSKDLRGDVLHHVTAYGTGEQNCHGFRKKQP